MTERCAPPECIRAIGHDGPCKPNRKSAQVCGATLPLTGETCARVAGHAGRKGWGDHQSRSQLDRAAARRRVA